MFEALSVEDPENINPGDWGETSTRSRLLASVTDSQPTSGKAKRKQETYSMESMHDDVLFAWLCFFMDFNEIRTYIRQIWSSYDASKISLVNACLLTNTAIEMIRSNCQSQLDAIEGLPFNLEEEDTISPWLFAHLGGDFDGSEAGRLSLFTPTGAEWDERELEETVKHPGKKRHENDYIWSQLLCNDLNNFTLLSCSDELPPSLDLITSLWKEIDYRQKTVPLWLNLSFQLILDTRHSLKGISKERSLDSKMQAQSTRP
jgi:hypothetical protein